MKWLLAGIALLAAGWYLGKRHERQQLRIATLELQVADCDRRVKELEADVKPIRQCKSIGKGLWQKICGRLGFGN